MKFENYAKNEVFKLCENRAQIQASQSVGKSYI